MNYIEVKFVCSPNNEIISSILSACLGEIGFESFIEDEKGITAYIQYDLFDQKRIDDVIEQLPVESSIEFSFQKIESKDWNEEWEKNYFKPLVIDNECSIQSTFHDFKSECKHQIFIDPKMAFGTGHHQTTELMIRQMLNTDFSRKSVLDMGCGTAILAILASMRGADPVIGIDIDKWAYDNAIENLSINNIKNVSIKIGGSELLHHNKASYDIILANINRNILLSDIKTYASVLNKDGILYMSGFYTEDIPAIKGECEKYGLKYCGNLTKDNWATVKFIN